MFWKLRPGWLPTLHMIQSREISWYVSTGTCCLRRKVHLLGTTIVEAESRNCDTNKRDAPGPKYQNPTPSTRNRTLIERTIVVILQLDHRTRMTIDNFVDFTRFDGWVPGVCFARQACSSHRLRGVYHLSLLITINVCPMFGWGLLYTNDIVSCRVNPTL